MLLGLRCSGIWCHITVPNILKEHSAWCKRSVCRRSILPSSSSVRCQHSQTLCSFETLGTSHPLTQHHPLDEWSPEPCCCENLKNLYVVLLQVFTLLTSSITTVQLAANFLLGSQHWTNTCTLTVKALFLATGVTCAAKNMLPLRRFRWLLQSNFIWNSQCIEVLNDGLRYQDWTSLLITNTCLTNAMFCMILSH